MAEQVVQPRMRGFISLTAHPEGCAVNVRRQVASVQAAGLQGELGNVLVLGSSSGYGLASVLTACFGYRADVLGVCFEREPTEDKTGTAGWYNLVEAHRLAREQGRTLETVNGDAFSHEVKAEVIEALRERFGPLDLVIYSLAAPRRRGPAGETWNSALKPVGETYTGPTFDLRTGAVVQAHLEPATDEELAATIKVMGGEDWQDWIVQLRDAGLLAPGCRTVAYSYIGPEVSAPIYRRGTIGRAKEHLEASAAGVDAMMREAVDGRAWVSVNAAVVTQASSAIPAVPLYMSALFRVLKERGEYEGPQEQILRLFRDHIGPGQEPSVDSEGRIRVDDLELQDEVQQRVVELWQQVTSENVEQLTDYAGYRRDFEQLFGFGVAGVDYDAPTEVDRPLE